LDLTYHKPAPNWRFGVSGGVARLKVSANLQVLYPARASVSRHPRQAALTLSASGGQRSAFCKPEKSVI